MRRGFRVRRSARTCARGRLRRTRDVMNGSEGVARWICESFHKRGGRAGWARDWLHCRFSECAGFLLDRLLGSLPCGDGGGTREKLRLRLQRRSSERSRYLSMNGIPEGAWLRRPRKWPFQARLERPIHGRERYTCGWVATVRSCRGNGSRFAQREKHDGCASTWPIDGSQSL